MRSYPKFHRTAPRGALMDIQAIRIEHPHVSPLAVRFVSGGDSFSLFMSPAEAIALATKLLTAAQNIGDVTVYQVHRPEEAATLKGKS